jgi:hypothetical protein
MLPRLAFYASDFDFLKPRIDSSRNAACHLILQFKNILERPFVAAAPQLNSGGCINELGRDANAVSELAHRAVYNISHTKLAADLVHVHLPALVGEC